MAFYNESSNFSATNVKSIFAREKIAQKLFRVFVRAVL